VGQYPGLPQNAIAQVQRAHRPPVNFNQCLNDQMNTAHNDRRRQHNLRQQQDRDEIRQQVQAELMAAGMQPPQVPQIPDEPIQPAPPAPPQYGPMHYEGAVGPHNFDNPLHYFAPNPAPPLPALPGPDYQEFNMQFQHHFQEEQMRMRNDLLQRQAEEAFRRQQIQLHLQQQEAERINREAQHAFEMQQQQAERINRKAHHAHQMQQQQAE
jgi:hypothetical protein